MGFFFNTEEVGGGRGGGLGGWGVYLKMWCMRASVYRCTRTMFTATVCWRYSKDTCDIKYDKTVVRTNS